MTRINRRLARRATEALIRQEMDQHPVERGEHWRDDASRVREIKKCIIDCGEEPTDEAVATQFHYETGRYWKVAWPTQQSDREKAAEITPHAPVDRED